MKLFLIRLLLIALLWLLLTYVIHVIKEDAMLAAFVIAYIFEPLITAKI